MENITSPSLQERHSAGGTKAPPLGPHCSTPKLNRLIQPFPSAFEHCFSTSCSKGWFTGKVSTIPTNPQVERVFKGIESGLSELTLGITAGLRKYFQKSISLKAANAFLLLFFFSFTYMRSGIWPQLNETVLVTGCCSAPFGSPPSHHSDAQHWTASEWTVFQLPHINLFFAPKLLIQPL